MKIEEMNKILKILLILYFMLPGDLLAHPGAKDRYGGHWDHKRNEYHCHSSTCVPPSCAMRESDYRCGNRYYGERNYAPGGRNDPAKYR